MRYWLILYLASTLWGCKAIGGGELTSGLNSATLQLACDSYGTFPDQVPCWVASPESRWVHDNKQSGCFRETLNRKKVYFFLQQKLQRYCDMQPRCINHPFRINANGEELIYDNCTENLKPAASKKKLHIYTYRCVGDSVGQDNESWEQTCERAKQAYLNGKNNCALPESTRSSDWVDGDRLYNLTQSTDRAIEAFDLTCLGLNNQFSEHRGPLIPRTQCCDHTIPRESLDQSL